MSTTRIESTLKNVTEPTEDKSIQPAAISYQSFHNRYDAHPEKYAVNPDDIYTKPEDKLGEGGFARVYKGTYKNNIAAIKIVELNKMQDKSSKRIHHEPKMMHIINDAKNEIEALKPYSNHIVEFYGFFVVEEFSVIAMEYVENGTLEKWICSSTADSDWHIRWQVLTDIFQSLHFLHELGLIYYDLKPENILLTKDMRAKLCDFDFTQFNNGAKVSSGTYRYISPEVFNATGPYTEKADIYALGIIIWEMTARKKACSHINSLSALTDWIESKNHEKFPKDSPKKIKLTGLWCWEERPERRPSTGDLLKEFETGITSVSNRLKKH